MPSVVAGALKNRIAHGRMLTIFNNLPCECLLHVRSDEVPLNGTTFFVTKVVLMVSFGW